MKLVIAMKKIDVHTHLIGNICGIGSEGELTPIGGGKAVYASGKVIQLIPQEYGDKSLTPEVLTSVLKANDVEFSVCLQGNYAGFQNIYTYEAALKYPKMLIPAGTYDPFFRNKQLVVHHLFEDLEIKVLKMEVSNGSGLMANHPTVDLNGEVMHEVYQMAKEHHLICFIDIGRPGNNCYQVEALSKAIKNYPEITFIICHLTAPQHEQMPILEENLNLLNMKNVYFDIASLPNNTKQPYPFLEAQSYIRKAIDVMGMNKILWGSDFPAAMNYCSYKQAYSYIEDSKIFTEEEKEHILYKNAKKLFGGLIK
ncbi:MAG: amidohydrolase [Anaeroplasma bactoclasticum]|nr:amidohydrolase [Anaeroplasma bactoclasticum]